MGSHRDQSKDGVFAVVVIVPPPPKLPYGEDNARLCVKSHNIGIVRAHAIHTQVTAPGQLRSRSLPRRYF